eukprot:1195480-Amphidinium_carterae.1
MDSDLLRARTVKKSRERQLWRRALFQGWVAATNSLPDSEVGTWQSLFPSRVANPRKSAMHGLSRLVAALENSTVSDATDLDEPIGMIMQAPPLHRECGKLENLRRIWNGWTLSECCSILLTSTPLTPKHSLGPYWLKPNNARFVRPDEPPSMG